MEQQWGDVAAGVWMRLSRFALLKLNTRKILPRNWRPILLLFVSDIKKRINIVQFAELLGQNSGILTISKLIRFDDAESLKNKHKLAFEMQKDLKSEGLEALTEVNVVSDIKSGMLGVAAAHGLGGLKTNTIVFGWSQDQEGKEEELKIINDLSTSGKNILLLHFNENFSETNAKNIHIWWGGKDTNGDLMLLLSYLIRLNSKWKKTDVRIFSVVETESEKAALEARISSSLKEARIEAKVSLILQNGENFISHLHNTSKEADLVFLGLAKDIIDIPENCKSIDEMVSGLKVVAFVRNNGMKAGITSILK